MSFSGQKDHYSLNDKAVVPHKHFNCAIIQEISNNLLKCINRLNRVRAVQRIAGIVKFSDRLDEICDRQCKITINIDKYNNI